MAIWSVSSPVEKLVIIGRGCNTLKRCVDECEIEVCTILLENMSCTLLVYVFFWNAIVNVVDHALMFTQDV